MKENNMSEEEIIKILNEITSDDLLNCWEGGEQEYKAIQGLLDLYTHKKGRVEELKQELLQEKEKNKELEDCLQMAKQIMTVDISEDFDYMELKQFREYLLNEIKINENFEE